MTSPDRIPAERDSLRLKNIGQRMIDRGRELVLAGRIVRASEDFSERGPVPVGHS